MKDTIPELENAVEVFDDELKTQLRSRASELAGIPVGIFIGCALIAFHGNARWPIMIGSFIILLAFSYLMGQIWTAIFSLNERQRIMGLLIAGHLEDIKRYHQNEQLLAENEQLLAEKAELMKKLGL